MMEKDCGNFAASGMHILIALDTPVNVAMFKGLLKNTQIQIDVAGSGTECVACAEQAQYHMIFADTQLADMDGVQILHRIQEDEKSLNQGTPVIGLVSDEMPDTGDFADYLEMPIDGRRLHELIEKYLSTEQAGSDAGKSQQAGNGAEIGGISTDSDLLTQVRNLPGVDMEAGIQACATEEIYLSVLKEFYPPAEKQATAIETYWHGNDFRNYTILVHSLKSSARLLGALELSEHAKRLEAYGNAATSTDIEASTGIAASEEARNIIQAETPALLQAYRNYATQLCAIFEPKEAEAAKPLIEDKMLREALEALREWVEGFDFDSADAVMDTLAKYRMPDYFQKNYQELKSLMAEVARDDIIGEINAFFSREEH